MKQCTDHVFLVKPSNFGFNHQAASSNHFQHKVNDLSHEQIQQNVTAEFELLYHKLIEYGVKVKLFEDTQTPIKPDAIFPNNWLSINNDNIVIYPMANPNRRTERRADIIGVIQQENTTKSILDLSNKEEEGVFLEGTGSIVFDHENRKAYACVSERTHPVLFSELCQKLNYKPVHFNAYDQNGQAIYHTNVMMSISNNFALVCLESITDTIEKQLIVDHLKESQKEIIDFTLEQMNHFAGNMLTLKGDKEFVQVMSKSAYNQLNSSQLQSIEKWTTPLVVDIPTIEKIGGGSVRCMIAEIFD